MERWREEERKRVEEMEGKKGGDKEKSKGKKK